MKKVVYDIETLKSCFTYTDIDIETNEIKQFVLHKERFELESFFMYLKTVTHQIGFNNVNFDYVIIHLILNKASLWLEGLGFIYTESEIITEIYQKAQEIIYEQDKVDFYKTVAIAQKDWKIKQLDLFKLWHYNNKARATSLKSLEISMNYPNVMEMPMLHDRTDIQLSEIDSILEYNLNDVLATFEFYKKSKQKIDLRTALWQKYNLYCYNFSDSKIGEQLILKLYCDRTGKSPFDVKELRTYRKGIKIKDCIFNYISFKNDCFNKLLNNLKNKVVDNTKGVIEEYVVYKGFKYDFGSGGIHGCIKAGIYNSDDNYVIIDCDVASLYPNIAIVNNLYPQHLGNIFTKVYKEDIVDTRLKAKAEGNTTLADGFKLSANSVYGKSNDINSFLYDPVYTLKTTINGQLMLAMLAEKLVNNINDLTMLQINTDGLTIKIPRTELEFYYGLCNDWELETKLTLEYVEYSKMVIRDVNNYLAVTDKGKIKYKGAFEIDKVVGNEPAYHKDNSFRIVPIALREYFVNHIPVENTIKFHFENQYKDIENYKMYDFCGRQKFKSGDYGEINWIDYDLNNNPYSNQQKQQKNTRYYISTGGCTFVKRYGKGTEEIINKGYLVTIFNKFEEKTEEEYGINYDFYIKECKKIIDIIQPKQVSLLL